MPRLSTALESGDRLREISVCSAVITCAAQTMASWLRSGYAPWPEVPWITSVTESVEALSVPARVSTVPTGRYGCTCRPYTRSTPAIAPAATIGSAPPSVSSAGWNSRRTVPGRRSRMDASARAAPSSMAVCASCPQACIMPSCAERKGQPSGSSSGRASMSARRATVSPGSLPWMVPITQVRCVVYGMPSASSVSMIRRWVLTSAKPGSGI